MEKKDLPIGYWIKQVDQLLTEGIDRIQLVHGISRIDWQILHSIKQETTVELQLLVELLQPFANEAVVQASVDKMVAKGWITSQQETYSVTVSGEVFYEDCLQQQTQFRKKAMQGINPAQYESTIDTLQKMLDNLVS